MLSFKIVTMTVKQFFLKWVYPIFMKISAAKANILSNTASVEPVVSVYDLEFELNNGTKISIGQFAGKKIILVNTASDCGYTAQYDELQKLHEEYGEKLAIVGFPSNDFKNQETKSDEDIAQFCKINFGVTFPLAKKSVVSKMAEQNKVFEWLSHKNKNGWNETAPYWNFTKYVINEKGVLTHVFHPAISPLSEAFLKAL